MDSIEIQELVDWELTTMDYTSLQDYFHKEQVEYYISNPKAYKDMKIYMNECKELWGGIDG